MSLTLREIWPDYRRTRKPKESTVSDYEKRLTRISDWLDVPLDQITPDMVQARHTELSESSPSNANLVFKVLRALYNYALIRYPEQVSENPVKRLSELRAWNRIKRRKTIIKPSQISDFWLALGQLDSPVQGDYLRTLLLTGLRRNEGATLTWRQVDFKEKTITVLDTKNGEDHTLPMGRYLTGIMQERHESRFNEFVFSSMKRGCISPSYHPFATIKRLSGVDFKLHDLRRTFNTLAVGLGIHPFVIAALMNHKSQSVTQGYYCPCYEQLREPMQQIEDHILDLANTVI